MILHLIRHGESAFNAEGRIQGQIDVPLSPLGVRQSEALATALGGRPIDAVYCSPLLRAMQTAKPLAAALAREIQTDPRLMEIHAGIFQGRLWSEIADLYPQEAALWAAHDPDFVIPGGESRRQLAQRGRAALEAIRATGLAQVAVVAHGGVLSAALKSLLNIPPQRSPFAMLNASICTMAWDNEVKLQSFNQVDHLPQREGKVQTRGGDL